MRTCSNFPGQFHWNIKNFLPRSQKMKRFCANLRMFVFVSNLPVYFRKVTVIFFILRHQKVIKGIKIYVAIKQWVIHLEDDNI